MKKSFKLFATVMVCMAMALCVSCKKDDDKSDSGGGNGGGSQTVEMRISKESVNMVSYEEESTDGGQTWNVIDVDSIQSNRIYTWNNNLLSNIKRTVQDGGECEEIDYDFRYDNNKLSNVIMTEWQLSYGVIKPYVISANVTYDGDNMSEVTYDDGELVHKYYLEYSNGKLSSVTSDQYVCNYFWNGDNLSEIIGRFESDENNEDVKMLSYDDKKNPYYGIDALLIEYGSINSGILSKNNQTKIEQYYGELILKEEHDYTYNDRNYPTQCVATAITLISDGHRGRYVGTVTYEYLD